jgi:hypothetical protein
MVRWAFGFASVFGVSTAAVVAVNPGGVVSSAVDTIQQVRPATNAGGTNAGSTGGGPSLGGSCRSH